MLSTPAAVLPRAAAAFWGCFLSPDFNNRPLVPVESNLFIVCCKLNQL
jgi:hypothetical protein